MTLKSHTWLIALALAAVFAAGTGFAFILNAAREQPDEPPPPELEIVANATWVDTTLERLTSSLDLRPEQVDSIRSDIANAELDVENTRERAMLEYHLLLLKIHQDIAPKLDPDQQKKLEESAKALQLAIKKRFPSSVEESNFPTP